METITYGGINVDLPAGLSENINLIKEIISKNTWNTILDDKQRGSLLDLLPNFPEDDQIEKTRALEKLFGDENFNFGSPIAQFHSNLKQFHYNPFVNKLRKRHTKYLYKNYRQKEKKRLHNLLEEVLVKRKYLLENGNSEPFVKCTNEGSSSSKASTSHNAAVLRSSREYFKEMRNVKAEACCDSGLSEDEQEKVDISLNKRQRRQICLMEATLPEDSCLVRSTQSKGSFSRDLERSVLPLRNPLDLSEEQFRNLVAQHLSKQRAGVCPSLDTTGITLRSIMHRCDCAALRQMQRPSHPDNRPSKSSVRRKRPKLNPKSGLEELQEIPKMPLAELQEMPMLIKDIKVEPAGDLSSESDIVDFADSVRKASNSPSLVISKMSLPACLTQKTHACFFSLLRDIFGASSNQRLRQRDLLASCLAWQASPVAPLNSWSDTPGDSWGARLPSAVNFLSANASPDALPSDFVPYIDRKPLGEFQWIGAGRDRDRNLQELFQFWLRHGNKIPVDWPRDIMPQTNAVPSPLMKAESSCSRDSLSTSPSIFTEKPKGDFSSDYHQQEWARYAQPHKSFTFRLNGFRSVIGPVKGVYGLSIHNAKAREHQLLISSRPPYVTILSLVWDAAARLPNNEGTKQNICELVKESQFLVPIDCPAMENSLNAVVSGALDRLQNEKDPCIKFDTVRKLWMYLHKNRTEEELEMMHQLKSRNGPAPNTLRNPTVRKGPKKRDDSIWHQGPPNVVMEQFTSSIKQMDGSEVPIRADDVLKQSDKILSARPRKEKPRGGQLTPRGNKEKYKYSSRATQVAAASNPAPPNAAVSSSAEKEDTSLPDPEACRDSPQRPLFSCGQESAAAAYQKSKMVSPSSDILQLKTLEGVTAHHSSAVKLVPASAVTPGSNPAKAVKILQYSNPNKSAGSGGGKSVGSAQYVLDNLPAALPGTAALVGHKLYLSGNNILVQGGKVMQGAGGTPLAGGGKPVLTGLIPTQLMPLANLKGNLKQVQPAAKLPEGVQYVQLSTLEPDQDISKSVKTGKSVVTPTNRLFQPKSDQFKSQKLQLLADSTSPKSPNQSLNVHEKIGRGKTSATGKDFPRTNSSNSVNESVNRVNSAADAKISRKNHPLSNEVKLKLTPAALSSVAGNIISLDGKQILVTARVNPNTLTIQENMASAGSGGDKTIGTDGVERRLAVIPAVGVAGAAPGQRVGVVGGARGGQRIVLPASALTGTRFGLKRLQSLQSFKVIPASRFLQRHQIQPPAPMVVQATTSGSAGGGSVAVAIRPDAPKPRKDDKNV